MLPIFLGAIVICAVLYSLYVERRAEREEEAAVSLMLSVFELSQLTDYYLVHQEERPRDEWFAKQTKIAVYLSKKEFENPEQQTLLERMRSNLDDMKRLFTAVVETSKTHSNGGNSELERDALDRLAGQLSIRARFVSDDALRIFRISSSEIGASKLRSTVLVIALTIVLLLLIGITLMSLNRGMQKSMEELSAGVKVIGSGNLDHRLSLSSDDEFGILEKAFNDMMEDLKRVTATRDDLTREVLERKKTEQMLRETEKRLEADLDAMTRLQKVGTLFVREGNLEPVLGEIVDAAIAISSADFGNIQLLDSKSSDLKIAAHRGFPEWWLDFWDSVCEGQGACGTALERGERVIVEDVEQSPIFIGTPSLEIQLKAGIRAVQSTPLVSRSGKPLGMFSTHYKTAHRPDDHTLQLLDLLARHTADIVERAQAEEALRQRTLELQHLTETLEARVSERTAELADLSSQLVSAQEKERQRVSYDLHDNVWQMLLTIRFNIERLFSTQDKLDWAALHNKSKEVMANVLSAVGKIRSMQGDLWPYVLDDIGILATIDWYCREFEKNHSGLTIESHIEVEEDETPSSAKIVIYRVMQEAMSNVVKHSQANHVSLFLINKEHRVEFTVVDNGVGFDPEEAIAQRAPWGGLGLLNIKARTELSGGIFGVESAKGKGTTIRASWPIPANNPR
ncbi:MAG: GAF domain-containing protein [Thermodesulfobacteriota bacterium]